MGGLKPRHNNCHRRAYYDALPGHPRKAFARGALSRESVCNGGKVTRNRDLVLIRKLCGLGLPAQTLAPSLLPALRQVIPAHSAAVFWVDERFEMTGLYAERLLPPDAMARYYDKHYQQPVTGFPRAFGARAAAPDP